MTIREELNDLLDFVEDIPDESKEPIILAITSDSNNETVEILRKRVRELEDSCENMSQVERNLHKEVDRLRQENFQLLTKTQL